MVSTSEVSDALASRANQFSPSASYETGSRELMLPAPLSVPTPGSRTKLISRDDSPVSSRGHDLGSGMVDSSSSHRFIPSPGDYHSGVSYSEEAEPVGYDNR